MNDLVEESLRWHSPVKKVISRYWWVILFVSLCAAIYASSVAKKQQIIASLDQQLSALELQTQQLKEIQQDLRLQIDSQSDPAWIQLTLMKVLGLVPEGQSKVYFYNEVSSSAVR